VALSACGFVRLPGMRFGKSLRTLLAALVAAVVPLVIAPAAMAADGVGVYGRTNDKVVTFFAFGLIAFFAIFVTVLSLIQIRLDNRKERRTQDLERLGSR
jgi:putative copper export protein